MKVQTIERLGAAAFLGLVLTFPFSAAAAEQSGADKADKETVRSELRQMRKDTLEALYKEDPKARVAIRGSAGYAVFASAGAHVLFLGGSGGRGILRENLTGKDTFMRMSAVRAGLGIGFEDVRTILVFKKRDTLKKFLEDGWTFGGETAAVAESEGQGAGKRDIEPVEGIVLYQLTKTGAMARGTVAGTKYWPDKELN